MPEAVEELVDSLLYEGYALYPYTPGATKNATPTPFGIVYPPAYAAECAGAFDHARLECVAEPGSGAELTATLRYLTATGDGHAASERRVDVEPIALGTRRTVTFDGGRVTLRSTPQPDGRARVRCCVHNTHDVAPGLSRAAALARSLLSVQLLVSVAPGRFRSPLEMGCESVNTYPVLAGEGDELVLGTTIVLPDHPRLAPESRGNLFDSTEIEEALLLHLQTLTDEERAQIERADPAVRAMVERAAAATPAEIVSLHGRVTLRDPVTTEPPRRAARVCPTRPPASPRPRSTACGSSAADAWSCVPRPTPTCTRGCSTAGARRSSGSWSTSTERSTSA